MRNIKNPSKIPLPPLTNPLRKITDRSRSQLSKSQQLRTRYRQSTPHQRHYLPFQSRTQQQQHIESRLRAPLRIYERDN